MEEVHKEQDRLLIFLILLLVEEELVEVTINLVNQEHQVVEVEVINHLKHLADQEYRDKEIPEELDHHQEEQEEAVAVVEQEHQVGKQEALTDQEELVDK